MRKVISKSTLPELYVPYRKLVFCSNIIEGGGLIVEVSGSIPILVGKGDPPKVWMSARRENNHELVVENSSALTKNITSANVFGGTVIMSNGVVILSARQISEDEAEVDQVDMRPLGLNIFGDKNGLKVGGMSLSGNTFSGVGVMLGIGD